jgi:hypothetical protein
MADGMRHSTTFVSWVALGGYSVALISHRHSEALVGNHRHSVALGGARWRSVT